MLYEDTLEFYASGALGKKTLDKEKLSQIPILTDRHAHLSHDRPLSRVLTELELYSAHSFQLNSFQAALRFATKGLGIALLPTRIGENARTVGINRVKVRGLSLQWFQHEVCCSYLETTYAKKGVQRLVQHLRRSLSAGTNSTGVRPHRYRGVAGAPSNV